MNIYVTGRVLQTREHLYRVIHTEPSLQTACKLLRYWRHLNYFLLKT